MVEKNYCGQCKSFIRFYCPKWGKYVKSLLDAEFEKGIKLKKENEQLKQDLSEYCNFSLHDVLDKKNKEIEQLKADKQALIDFIKKGFPKSHKHILEGFE